MQALKTATLADGTVIPALGQGTWMMGEDAVRRAKKIAALRAGVAVGMTVIDTAEMYGDGAAETLVGEAVAGMLDDVFLVSKAYPQNASRTRLEHSCDASLARLGTDRLDLYLLHWRGTVPLGETVEAMNRLVDAGKILRWGVSNLDTDDMEELFEAGGAACATDQILYNLTRRGPELDLLPWLGSHGIALMAYSPVEQGRLLDHETLGSLASRRGVSTADKSYKARDIPEGNLLIHIPDPPGKRHRTLDCRYCGPLVRISRALSAADRDHGIGLRQARSPPLPCVRNGDRRAARHADASAP